MIDIRSSVKIVVHPDVFKRFRSAIQQWERDTGIRVYEDVRMPEQPLSSRITPIRQKPKRTKR